MVRYAVIGSGMMGQEHIRYIDLLEDAVVSAVADPDDGMREEAARLVGAGVREFSDHRTLLEASVADALIVASPNHTHAAVLDDVLGTDVPVLVEKPLCTTVADCERIVARAGERTAPVWVAMEYRYIPPIARLLEEVRSGSVGTLRMLTIREHRYPFLEKVGNWNRFARNTGGTLVEKCCHFFDLMRLIVDSEPVRVYASGAQDVNHLDETYGGERPDIVDNAYAIVDFASGVRACLELCMFAEGSYFQEHVSAVGDLGKVEAFVPGPSRFRSDGERDAELVVSRRDSEAPKRETVEVDGTLLAAGDHHGSTYFQHVAFNRLVREGGEPEVSAADGAIAVEMGLAAERSIATASPVSIG